MRYRKQYIVKEYYLFVNEFTIIIVIFTHAKVSGLNIYIDTVGRSKTHLRIAY